MKKNAMNLLFFMFAISLTTNIIAMQQPRMRSRREILDLYNADRDRILEETMLNRRLPIGATEEQKDALLKECRSEYLKASKQFFEESEASLDMSVFLTFMTGCFTLFSFCMPASASASKCDAIELMATAAVFLCDGCEKDQKADMCEKIAHKIDRILRQKANLEGQHSD